MAEDEDNDNDRISSHEKRIWLRGDSEGELLQLVQRMDSMERRLRPMLAWWEAGRSVVKVLTWIGGFMSGIAVIWLAFGDFIKAHLK